MSPPYQTIFQTTSQGRTACATIQIILTCQGKQEKKHKFSKKASNCVRQPTLADLKIA